MSHLEGWGFLSLMGCTLSIVVSLSLLSGGWQAAGCGLGALLAILSGGLYAASARPSGSAGAEQSAAPDPASLRDFQ